MKKNILFLLLTLVFFFVGCQPEETIDESIVTYSIFAINDFHGAVMADNGGFSVIGEYLISEKEKNPDHTVILSSGDMFQGSALSNMTKGGVVVAVMNEIGFDSMTVGNHEFDWGYEVIANYNNQTSEVKADFPIICANIYEKSTDQPVDWCEPYTIIERGGLKIGVIGIIGKDLTNSIATKIIEPFEFKDTIPLIKKYARELRIEKECDLVFVSAHADTGSFNQQIADLNGTEQIDAVFNAHTHNNYAGETQGSDGILLPYIQSGSSGSHIGKVTLTYDRKNKEILSVSAENITVHKKLNGGNNEINAIINHFNQEIAVIANEVVGIAGETVNRFDGAKWAANVIRDYSYMDVGIINYGGIRASAFPINALEEITIDRIWQLMPFDNFVKTCTMTASDVVKACSVSDTIYSTNIKIVAGMLYVNNEVKNNNDLINVGVIDYIFDKTTYPFLKSQNQKETGILFRDFLIQAIRDACENENFWYPTKDF